MLEKVSTMLNVSQKHIITVITDQLHFNNQVFLPIFYSFCKFFSIVEHFGWSVEKMFRSVEPLNHPVAPQVS
jgi:hypothetical protein